ncbi:uncharacterized protein [Engystomops pustulosus]|uniref:uncharacterized protein isoform X4 n=1 Tax=Engystomops pustulosus TaxID=76066 RepID=UPI003AFB7C4D
MKQTPARRKQTATNSLLSFTSFHPKHLRQSIPVGQFLRLRRNCSDIADFRKHAKDLTGRFRARGYPKKVLHLLYPYLDNTIFIPSDFL